MDRRQLEPVTSTGLAILACATALLIIFLPERAALWIVPAPLLAAIGCFIGVRVCLRFRAPGSATVFIVQTLFWLGATAYILWLALT